MLARRTNIFTAGPVHNFHTTPRPLGQEGLEFAFADNIFKYIEKICLMRWGGDLFRNPLQGLEHLKGGR
jgi:hypothetical protein